MLRPKATLLAALGLALAAVTGADAITFQEIARFDVSGASSDVASPDFIGNNPSAVAWDAGKLYVAGFVNGPASAQSAIIEVTNAGSTGANVATFSSAFGGLTTPNTRGFSGLDLENGVLAAAYDDGAADPNGIRAFNAATNTQTWAKNARGGSGVAHDPGFASVDSGVAWATFGSGRRSLQNTATGADIYTTANGMIITDFGGSFWRDLDFDQSTGDLYARRANDVLKTTRTGGNSGTVSVIVDTNENAPFVAGQNIDFMATADFGDLVVYNDRASTLGGQSFFDVVKVIDPAGAAASALFSFTYGAPALGVGYYDFDFDTASQTLAIVDFSSRNVHIFQVVPEPSALGLLVAAAMGCLGRRRNG
ncbi:PEP-CTERM sorting domain-containing protein [Botrimarina hoheduenensis]|uniref:PEP-CTERM protein-sorting domain-containing protein n=1 Tax=Botrimarina hoheduenensis TaxID=2528000 RepID=A0A5C5WE00_9BACT|nr:PEP-CTERM sorting domain-containing protein [Botrimarina hoheduenensis]TWT48289.1 hypothetical protein Pla111_00510 [Botrimarina hoheduenensis]